MEKFYQIYFDSDLNVVFCGMAAGNRSAAIRAYYAGRGNKFWRVLADIGLTTELLQPSQFHSLPDFGIGLTDVAKYASGNDVDILHSDRDPGAVRAKILRYLPKKFALAEVTPSPRPSPSGRGRSDASHPAPGASVRSKGEMLGFTSIYVLPSTSGSANGYWDVSYWRELAYRILAFGV